jgi:hypothetical protein
MFLVAGGAEGEGWVGGQSEDLTLKFPKAVESMVDSEL